MRIGEVGALEDQRFPNASMIPFAATGIRVPGPYASKQLVIGRLMVVRR